MNRKLALVIGSSRKSGNTSQLANAFMQESQFPIQVYDLLDYDFSGFDYDHANLQDDFIGLVEKLIDHTDIIFATPVYWYSMSSVMKKFFDRTSDLITVRKDLGRSLKGKRTWLMANGSDPILPEGFEVPFKRTSDYFEMNYSGSFYIEGEVGVSSSVSKNIKRFLELF